MSVILFWPFAAVMLIGSIGVIAFKNPVASAISMVAGLLGLAALFIGLSAFFVGIIQILVYAGAIMVLFIFIIMLLDIKSEKTRSISWLGTAAGIALAAIFTIQLIGVLGEPLPNQESPALNPETFATAAENFPAETHIARELNEGKLPDVHLIGHTLFTQYNFPIQILGVLLLVATVGVVVLSKRQSEHGL